MTPIIENCRSETPVNFHYPTGSKNYEISLFGLKLSTYYEIFLFGIKLFATTVDRLEVLNYMLIYLPFINQHITPQQVVLQNALAYNLL